MIYNDKKYVILPLTLDKYSQNCHFLTVIYKTKRYTCKSSKMMAETSKFKRKFTRLCFSRLSFTQCAIRSVWYDILVHVTKSYRLNMTNEFCSIIVSSLDAPRTWIAKQYLCSSTLNKCICTFWDNDILPWYFHRVYFL